MEGFLKSSLMHLYSSLTIAGFESTAVDIFFIEVWNILFVGLEISLVFAFDDADITDLLPLFGIVLLFFLPLS